MSRHGNKIQQRIETNWVGASWRGIFAERRPLELSHNRQVRGPGGDEATFTKFVDETLFMLQDDLLQLQNLCNSLGIKFSQYAEIESKIRGVKDSKSWKDLSEKLFDIRERYKQLWKTYDSNQSSVGGKPQPSKFQEYNRLGWNEKQYKQFLANASGGKPFRVMIKKLASSPSTELLSQFVIQWLNYAQWFRYDHPYPGIVKLINVLASEDNNVKPNMNTVAKAASGIEKRISRLYDFARLEKVKSLAYRMASNEQSKSS